MAVGDLVSYATGNHGNNYARQICSSFSPGILFDDPHCSNTVEQYDILIHIIIQHVMGYTIVWWNMGECFCDAEMGPSPTLYIARLNGNGYCLSLTVLLWLLYMARLNGNGYCLSLTVLLWLLYIARLNGNGYCLSLTVLLWLLYIARLNGNGYCLNLTVLLWLLYIARLNGNGYCLSLTVLLWLLYIARLNGNGYCLSLTVLLWLLYIARLHGNGYCLSLNVLLWLGVDCCPSGLLQTFSFAIEVISTSMGEYIASIHWELKAKESIKKWCAFCRT